MGSILTLNGNLLSYSGSALAGEISTVQIESGKEYTVSSGGTSTILPTTGYGAMDSVILTVPSKSAATYTPTTSNQTIAAGQWLNGVQTISGDENLTPSNIKQGASIFGITGTFTLPTYTLLASAEFTTSSTSTTAASIGTVSAGASAYTSNSILYVKVRDKAGPRAGYFLGSDSFFINVYPVSSATTTLTVGLRYVFYYSSSSRYGSTTCNSTTGYGVYGYSVASNGDVAIYRRYNSSSSLTINGTYNVEVYLLDFAPNTGNPFNYSFS